MGTINVRDEVSLNALDSVWLQGLCYHYWA